MATVFTFAITIGFICAILRFWTKKDLSRALSDGVVSTVVSAVFIAAGGQEVLQRVITGQPSGFPGTGSMGEVSRTMAGPQSPVDFYREEAESGVSPQDASESDSDALPPSDPERPVGRSTEANGIQPNPSASARDPISSPALETIGEDALPASSDPARSTGPQTARGTLGNRVTFSLPDCARKGHKVFCRLTITNHDEDMNFGFGGGWDNDTRTRLIDGEGGEHSWSHLRFGNQESDASYMIPTVMLVSALPTPAELEFDDVPVTTDRIALLQLYAGGPLAGHGVEARFRGLPIGQ